MARITIKSKAAKKFSSLLVHNELKSHNFHSSLFPKSSGTQKNYERKLQNAQYYLDEAVKQGTEPYVPFRSGALAGSVNILRSGLGVVQWSGPQAVYLYKGRLMVYPGTGSPKAPLGEKKVVTKKKLTYDRQAHPLAGALWYDRAYKVNRKKWVEAAKEGFRNG